MENARPFAPSFVDRLDRWLLLNKPGLWSSRIHLLLYYGLLFAIALTGLALIAPDDPRSDSDVSGWVGFVSLLSFIGLVIWCIYLLRFNTFKRFGDKGPLDRLANFVLTFLSIGFIVAMPFIEPYVECVKANVQYPKAQMVDDVNALNLSIAQLEYDSLDHNWSTDTLKLMRPATGISNNPVEARSDTVAVRSFHVVSPQNLQEELAYSDSSKKMNDSIYVIYYSPAYIFLDNYTLKKASGKKLYSSFDIWKRLESRAAIPPQNELRKNIAAIQKRYIIDPPEYLHTYYEEDRIARIGQRYYVNDIENSIDNILYRQERWSDNASSLFRIHFYITLCLSLLLFTFRHSTPRSFFFGLLTAVILSVFTALMVAFAHGPGGGFFGSIIFYFIVFFAMSFSVLQSSTRSTVNGIAINLFVWLLPFIPLCGVMAYYIDRDNTGGMERSLRIAEVTGIVVLLLMLPTLIHKFYRKWYGAAEQ